MTEVRDLPLVGPVVLEEVYRFYDEPVLFACRDRTDRVLIAVFADERPDGRTWVYVPMSLPRYHVVRAGDLDLRDAFLAPEAGHVLVVDEPDDAEPSADWRVPSHLPGEWFPKAGFRLNVATATLPAPAHDVQSLAEQTRRDVLRLAVELSDQRRTTAPAGLVGSILEAVQQVIYAVGQARTGTPTSRGVLPASIRGDMQLDLAAAYSGSFEVELQGAKSADLFGNSELSEAIEAFTALLAATEDQDELVRVLGELRGRSLSKYRAFLSRVGGTVHSVKVSWGSPSRDSALVRSISGEQASKAGGWLAGRTEDEEDTYEIVGRLVGFNERTKTYELWEVTEGQKFSGRVADDAMESVDAAVIGSQYVATIHEKTALDASGEPVTKYRLLALTQAAPEVEEAPEDGRA